MKRILIMLALAAVAACGGSEEQPQSPPQQKQAPTPQVQPAPLPAPVPATAPAESPSRDVPKLREMTTESVREFVEKFKANDPYAKHFTVEGRLRAAETEEYDSKLVGTEELRNMQAMAWDHAYMVSMFDALPTLMKRKVIETTAPIIAEHVVEYLHPELVQRWITGLDWRRDIERIDPKWWKEMDWYENKTKPIDIPGYGRVSKLDMWIRMFWKRRGEFVFNAVKQAMAEAKQSR